MLGRLALGLGLAAVTPAKPARRAPVKGGPVAILAIVAAVTLFVIGDATHTWTLAWFVVVPMVLSVFIAAGNIQHAFERRSKVQHRLAQLPDLEVVATATEMRERARQLQRDKRVRDLLAPACPLCAAKAGQGCTDVPGTRVYRLDSSRGLSAHPVRIQKAVSTGTAKLDDVTAQFSGRLPEDIVGGLL